MGMAIMGTGVAEGEDRAMDAATAAISSPLLEDASVKGARGVIINITGGPDLTLAEVSEASDIIHSAAHEDANIIFGAVVDPKMEGKVKITVIATGFDRAARRRSAPAAAAATTTPVDLQRPTRRGRRQPSERPLAATAAAMIVVAPAGARPAADAAGAGRSSDDRRAPGADEPVSPLDVPAFLRRQTRAEPRPSPASPGRERPAAAHRELRSRLAELPVPRLGRAPSRAWYTA